MKIAVTGAGGFLGVRTAAYYREKYETVGYTRETLDFTDEEQVKRTLERDMPDILIHTAAVSDIGACEKNPALSEKINVEGTKYLAKHCGRLGIRLIFCSSDQVYMGNGVHTPHKEEGENLAPPTLYGRQKLRAEELVSALCPDSVILRLSWMFAGDYREGLEHPNLLSNIKKALDERKELRYPVHDYRSLTDVWEVVKNLEVMFHAPAGIYNFGSENDVSTYDAVRCFLEGAGRGAELLEKNEEAFAACPRNLRMDGSRWKAAGAVFLTTEEAMKRAGKRELARGMEDAECSDL